MRDGLRLDLDHMVVQADTARPPVISVASQVPEKNVSQLVAQHAETASLVKTVMNDDTHLQVAGVARDSGETRVHRRKSLEVDADPVMASGVSDGPLETGRIPFPLKVREVIELLRQQRPVGLIKVVDHMTECMGANMSMGRASSLSVRPNRSRQSFSVA